MPKIAIIITITDAEAVRRLREHVATLPAPEKPEFEPGDAVRLDTGCVGVVVGTDDEGSASVVYLDDEGMIRGPSIGWSLERLDVGS